MEKVNECAINKLSFGNLGKCSRLKMESPQRKYKKLPALKAKFLQINLIMLITVTLFSLATH